MPPRPPLQPAPTVGAALSPTTVAMLLADARLPVGAHVHSAGLEPALSGGLSPHRVPAYLRGRARTVTLVEAGTAVVARHVAETGGADLDTGLISVDRAWAARTPSKEIREVSRSLARGYVRLALRLWPENAAVKLCAATPQPFSRPVVIGVIAAATGLDAESLVRLVVYDDAQTVAAALLKLEPVDPVIPLGWAIDACAAAEESVAALASLTSPGAIPAYGAPQTEDWAEAHATTTQRLFRA